MNATTARFVAGLALIGGFACNSSARKAPVAELQPRDDADADPMRIEIDDYRNAVARLRLTRGDSLFAKPLPPELKDYVLDRMIDDLLLRREADRLGVRASTLAVSREMAVLRASIPEERFRRLLVDTYQTEKQLEGTIADHLTAIAVLEKLTLKDVQVSDAEVRSAFDALPRERRIRPERIRAAQILVATEPEAIKIWRSLRLRRNFAQLAKKHSLSPERIVGGDLGWFARGELPGVFDEMCFPLKKGTFSHVTASEYGYHLCKVLDREPQRRLAFEEVRDELRHEIETDRVRQARTEVMNRLREAFEIVKNQRAIARVD